MVGGKAIVQRRQHCQFLVAEGVGGDGEQVKVGDGVGVAAADRRPV